jgi:hypothetical protein
MKVQYVLHLLSCTHQDDIRPHAKHFAIKAHKFLQSLFVFDPSSCSGLQAWAGRKFRLTQSPRGKSLGGGPDLEIAEARKWTPSADPYLRQLPIQEFHLIADVWWCSIMLENNTGLF